MEQRKSKDPENQLVQAGLLMDTYGPLLTERQRQFMRLHFEEDLSFSEIAREFQISRQAVHDSVKHAKESLARFEQVLGLAEKARGGGGTHIGGRQLLERLDRLRASIMQSGAISDPRWIVDELAALIGLLKGTEDQPGAAEEPAISEPSPNSFPTNPGMPLVEQESGGSTEVISSLEKDSTREDGGEPPA